MKQVIVEQLYRSSKEVTEGHIGVFQATRIVLRASLCPSTRPKVGERFKIPSFRCDVCLSSRPTFPFHLADFHLLTLKHYQSVSKHSKFQILTIADVNINE
jgi:hypothetical protein